MKEEEKNVKKEKQETENMVPKMDERETDTVAADMLTSKQEVAEALKMSLRTFERLEQKYTFALTGVTGRVNGRWRVSREQVRNWFNYVQRQESRHPDARRMRPEEPPDLQEIKGR